MKIASGPIWPPFTSLSESLPRLPIVKGRGAILHTRDGKKIIDAVSSWWVNLHGHAEPHIARAIARQAKQLEHVIFAGFTHPPAETLARELLPLLPGDFSKLFFSDDGSTSVEVALKLALQYFHNHRSSNTRILALEGAYHGDTFGAMSAGSRGLFSKPFDAKLFSVTHLPFPEKNREEKTITALQKEIKRGKIAAFIYEPLVQGAAGMRIYSPKVLEKILRLLRKENILLIADEVMTGFGRTGNFFASESCATKPDLLCLSKGITGGFLPMGVTAVSKKIVNAFATPDRTKTFFHGHSYTANPLACAAAVASLKLLTQKTCRDSREAIHQAHRKFINEMQGHSSLKNLRVCGTILAMEFALESHEPKSKQPKDYLSPLRDRLYRFFISQGVLLRPIGSTVYVLPPYVIRKTELAKIHSVLRLAAEKLPRL